MCEKSNGHLSPESVSRPVRKNCGFYADDAVGGLCLAIALPPAISPAYVPSFHHTPGRSPFVPIPIVVLR